MSIFKGSSPKITSSLKGDYGGVKEIATKSTKPPKTPKISLAAGMSELGRPRLKRNLP